MNEKIKKINQIGKIGRIVLTIARVLAVIALVCTLVGGVICLVAIPLADGNTIATVNGSAEFTVDMKDFPMSEQIISGFTDKDDFKFDMFGINLDVDSTENSAGSKTTINAGVDHFNVKPMPFFLSMAGICFAGALGAAAILVVIIYAKKMALALEKCSSPFERNVIASMKKFAYSLIPWGIIFGLFFSSLIMVIIIVLTVLAIVYIFSYGAELQQENDDTV